MVFACAETLCHKYPAAPIISIPRSKFAFSRAAARENSWKSLLASDPLRFPPHLNLIAANLTHLLNGKSPSSGKKSFFLFSSSFLQTLIIVFVDFPLFGGWLGKTFQLIYLRQQQQKQCRKVERTGENLLYRNTWSRHFSTQVAKTGFQVADQLAKRPDFQPNTDTSGSVLPEGWLNWRC